MGESALSCHEARELTLHSMKSTMLAAAAQLALPREDRLAQGHHRDSARLYARNDTFDSLRVQRRLTTQVAYGWRPSRSMARGGRAPLPDPPFSVSSTAPAEHLPAMDLHAGAWARFTSRHEALHSEAQPGTPSPSPTIGPDSDSEAEAVQAYAALQAASDDETTEDSADSKVLFVCNGPWSCLHHATETSQIECQQNIATGCNAPHALRDQARPRSDSTLALQSI